jgi:hypothetical protein
MDVDPAATAAAILAGKALLDGLGKEAGHGVWQGASRLAAAIRNRLTREADGLALLERVQSSEAAPADVDRLADLLRAESRRDPDFAAALQAVVSNVASEPEGARFLTVVRDRARVGKIVTIERVDGDVRF